MAPRTPCCPATAFAPPGRADHGHASLFRRPWLHRGRDTLRRRHTGRGSASPPIPHRPRGSGRDPASAVAAYLARVWHEASAGRGRRADLPAGPGVAQRRGRADPSARVFHVGMVLPRPVVRGADGRNRGAAPHHSAADRQRGWHHDGPFPVRAHHRRRRLRPLRWRRFAGDRRGRSGAGAWCRGDVARRRGLGGPVLSSAPRTNRTATWPRAPDLSHALAHRPGGPGPARSGRPARGITVRAVRGGHGACQRV